MPISEPGLDFKTSPSGLLKPTAVDNPLLGPGVVAVTVEMVGPADSSKVLRGTNPPTWGAESAIPVLNFMWAGPLPTVTGAGLVARVPLVNGASMTFDLQSMFSRLEVLPVGTTTFRIEKYTGTGSFSPTTVDSLSHTTSDYEKTKTLTGTVTSGDKLRVNFAAVAGSGGAFELQLLGVKH